MDQQGMKGKGSGKISQDDLCDEIERRKMQKKFQVRFSMSNRVWYMCGHGFEYLICLFALNIALEFQQKPFSTGWMNWA